MMGSVQSYANRKLAKAPSKSGNFPFSPKFNTATYNEYDTNAVQSQVKCNISLKLYADLYRVKWVFISNFPEIFGKIFVLRSKKSQYH